VPEGASDRSGDDNRAGRIGAEIGFEFGTLVLGAGFGALVGWAIAPRCSSSSSSLYSLCFGPEVYAPLGAGFGAAVGAALVPLTVALAGKLTGGRGNAGGAYLGFLAGGALAAGLIALGALAPAELGEPGGPVLLISSIAVGGLLALASPIVGYEIWDASERGKRPSISPAASLLPDGASIGVTGTF
jgi:hypothetical protein